MISLTYFVIVGLFLFYYFLVLIIERRIIDDPRDIISKFLEISLLYAGISIIYFSLTGNPFPGETKEAYSVYIFLIGFVALVWTIPELLKEFTFFRKIGKKKKISR